MIARIISCGRRRGCFLLERLREEKRSMGKDMIGVPFHRSCGAGLATNDSFDGKCDVCKNHCCRAGISTSAGVSARHSEDKTMERLDIPEGKKTGHVWLACAAVCDCRLTCTIILQANSLWPVQFL